MTDAERKRWIRRVRIERNEMREAINMLMYHINYLSSKMGVDVPVHIEKIRVKYNEEL